MSEPVHPTQTRRRRIIVGGTTAALLLPAPAMLAGCGGSGGDATAGDAQRNLVAIADRLDSCYAERGDARKCTGDDTLAGGDVPLGSGAGEVEVSVTRPTRYQLAMRVDEQTTFAILAQPVGARKRVCSPAGQGGCPESGVW